MKTTWLGAALLILGQSVGFGAGAGTSAGSVLNFGVGARAIALGEAYTALADDASSLYWNPAGVGLLNQSQTSFMYNQSFQEMSFSNAGFAMPLENGGLGASISYLGYGDIDGFDSTGQPTGNVNAYNGAVTVGGAWLNDSQSVSLGMNLKGVQGSLADVKANGVAADFGSTVVYPESVLGGATLRLAGTVRNLGTGMKYLEHRDPFPTQFRIGASLLQLMNNRLNLSLDYGKARDAKGAIYAGTEWRLNSVFALRAGYSGADVEGEGLRAGFGVKVRNLSFDYAYAHYGDLGMAHRYEMTYRFGHIRASMSPEMRKMLKRAKLDIRHERYDEAVLLLDALIRMEPDHKLFRRLATVAMKGNESQERYAKSNQNKYSGRNVKVRAEDSYEVSERKELEALLSISDLENSQAAVLQEKRK